MADKASDLLVDVLRVYSPSAREGRLASLIKRRMEVEFGYEDVHTDEAGNVVAEVGRGEGGSRTVLLCGHMDTVPGNLPVTVKDGRVFGRGAVDAKSPLCAMIAAGSAMRDTGMRVVVACVTREEGDGLGIQSLIKSDRKFDFAVFGEPGGNDRITVGYRGRLGVTLTTHTEGGHAGSPWAHESAVDASLSLLERLKRYEQEHQAADDHFRSLSLCLTMIRGGTY
ncbi:MAG: M20/M25/M40 family metallo-hydrolase, partial [Thaumarchaeota archaeon]